MLSFGNVAQVVGATPLVKLESLSRITGNNILAKAEFLNPGGSIKDRAALGIIEQAERDGLLQPGYTIVEGTAGNTGIGLATIAAQRGYKCVIVMPNNQAQEKYAILRALGAELITVAPCPFSSDQHFYHQAKRIASEREKSFWANQFENTANYLKHYATTGPEIWEQTNGQVNAFISAVGTGGTIAGVSRYLKEKKSTVHVRLVDPMGSGLYSYITTGSIAGTGASITEGIGIMRITDNFKQALIDDAVQVDDQKMISMLYYLAQHEGLLVGTSAALNVYAAYKYSLENQNKGLSIVTMLCDSAIRYQSKVFNAEFLSEKGLNPTSVL